MNVWTHLLFPAAAFLSLLAPAHPVAALRFSPDSRLVALAGGDRVQLLSCPGAEPEGLIETSLFQVFTLSWGPQRNLLAVGGGEPARRGVLEIYELQSGRLAFSAELFPDVLMALEYSLDGGLLAAGSADGRIGILDSRDGQSRAILSGHSGPVLSLAWSPEGRYLASGSADRSIRIWDVPAAEAVRTLTNHGGAVHALAYSADGKTLYSAGEDATVRVWDPTIGRMKRIIRSHDRGILALDYSPTRHLLVTGSADGHLRLINAGNGELVHDIPPSTSFPVPWRQAVDIAPDSNWLAWADSNGGFGLREFPE